MGTGAAEYSEMPHTAKHVFVLVLASFGSADYDHKLVKLYGFVEYGRFVCYPNLVD